MQAYSNPARESDPHALPDVEVFYISETESKAGCYAECVDEEGWYYWSCFPGCMPDSDPIGPFASKKEALDDAQTEE